MTHIYIKPSSNQRSTISREASAAGRLRPNAETGQVKMGPKTTSPVTRQIRTYRHVLRAIARRIGGEGTERAERPIHAAEPAWDRPAWRAWQG